MTYRQSISFATQILPRLMAGRTQKSLHPLEVTQLLRDPVENGMLELISGEGLTGLGKDTKTESVKKSQSIDVDFDEHLSMGWLLNTSP